MPAVGHGGDAEKAIAERFGAVDASGGGGVPQPQGAVAWTSAGNHPLAVGGQSGPFDPGGMAPETLQLLAAPDIPQANSLVKTAGQQFFAVGGKRHAGDFRLMAVEGANFLAAAGVP